MTLMAMKDILENRFIPSADREGKTSPTQDEWREMFNGTVIECKHGMSIMMDMVTAVGQKKE